MTYPKCHDFFFVSTNPNANHRLPSISIKQD